MSTVVIIGAGLSGLTLALALHQQGIECVVYESRPAPLNIGGAVMLSPNALRVLDTLNLYDSVKSKGFNFDVLHYRDVSGNLIETYEFGSREKYGFQALRIYRHVLIDALVDELKAKGIPVRFGKKFSHIVEDSAEEGATVAFTDGTTETTRLLVGADGIHSRVRRHLYPDLTPTFTGMAGITAAVPTAQLGLPRLDDHYHLPATILSPAHGAFVIAPQAPDGSEVLIGKQQRLDPQQPPGPPGWEKTAASRADAARFLRQDADRFPAVVGRATSRIDEDRINIWPFYVVPRLERWASATGRVLILGDAAHAVPPSAGQGINQAFEDALVLALLLGRLGNGGGGGGGDGDGVGLGEGKTTEGGDMVGGREAALRFWQAYRQERVDRVLELNRQIDLRRMPADDAVVGDGSGVAREEFDLEWLYKPDFRGVVDEWVAKQRKA